MCAHVKKTCLAQHTLQESSDEVMTRHLCGSEPWMPSITDHGEGHAAHHVHYSERPSRGNDGELAAVHPTLDSCTCCTLVSFAHL